MFGLFGGKPRTRLGEWLDKRGISQEWIVKKSGVSRNTVSRIASDKEYDPSVSTVKKIMKALKEIDPNAKPDDFFDM
jgi:predicted transcriptional regulator